MLKMYQFNILYFQTFSNFYQQFQGQFIMVLAYLCFISLSFNCLLHPYYFSDELKNTIRAESSERWKNLGGSLGSRLKMRLGQKVQEEKRDTDLQPLRKLKRKSKEILNEVLIFSLVVILFFNSVQLICNIYFITPFSLNTLTLLQI